MKISGTRVTHKDSMKLGGGGRFKKVEAEVAQEPGVRDPAAVAAAIGRRKYGAKKMASLAKNGK